MHQALYRKWRPQTFDEVCGQRHITDILKYETENGLFCHAYLFCGSRGTGKTTCAKILARAVNCENPTGGNPCGECAACRAVIDGITTDVLEMDAASNNKVDDIRTILDEVIYLPTMLKKRVYIIDEVHMLSGSAFNALLKTLEEPPEHVIFILATTEMQKLPATIISRCQRFDFRRISTQVLIDRLRLIADAEKIKLDDDAALMLARLSQGGMRDAISLFELCAGGGRAVSTDVVAETVGASGRGVMSRTVRAVLGRDAGTLFDIIAETDASALDIGVFWQELIGYYRDMLVMKTAKADAAVKYLDLTDAEYKLLSEDAAGFSRELLSYHSRLLDEAYASMQRPGASRRTVAELTLVRMCDEKLAVTPDALLARISALEARLAQGASTVPSSVPSPAPDDVPVQPDNVSDPGAVTGTGGVAVPSPRPQNTVPLTDHGGNDTTRSLRPLRCWVEIIDAFRRNNSGVAALLATERAFTDDKGRIVVCCSKEITISLASAPEKFRALCEAASLVLERPIGDGQILFEKVRAGEDPDDARILADELDAIAAEPGTDGKKR